MKSKAANGVWIGLFLFWVAASTGYAQPACTESYGAGPNKFSLATGSPGELGLLKALGEEFAKRNNTTLCWVKAGSGESMKFLKDKQVDMIMVHAPAAEKKAVEDGWATRRILIGSNEFYIVGPPEDPAGIKKAKTAAEAYALIANSQSKFFSRGDNSGTHKKEMDAWEKANIKPAGDWYVVTKDFMMATLKRADAEKGYFMTDSSTWVSVRNEMKNLQVLFRGDVFLVNTYHTLLQPEGATPGQKFASQFIDFVSSAEGQKIIAAFGKDQYGEGIYNDAAYAKQYDR
ncbi:MAG: substrate-binding domain-containing protein [Desulfobacterales bacterium]|jgi:tungstate transport system substrate-binding protein|nr:substrate-binding domain-containing protein [Desulfobacterales bacterium]